MVVLIKWFPPSWIQVKTKRQVLYIDPAYLRTNFTTYPKTIEYSRWPDPIDGLPEKLEKGDIILITHHHKDHCKNVTVRRLKKDKTQIFATKFCVKELGKEINIVKPGSEINVGDFLIKAIDAYNIKQAGKTKINHKKGNGVGYLLIIDGKIVYHAGDTDCIPEMVHLENIDVALIPIGGRDFTMGVSEALEAAKIINPKVVIPMHRYDSDLHQYKNLVGKDTTTKVELLDIGETYQL